MKMSKRIERIIDSTIKKAIQAAAEGSKDSVLLESLLTGQKLSTAIPGITNNYKDYESQVEEVYSKYNGYSDWGNQQTRALIDFRTAFIAGEGVSISAENPETAEWIERFIRDNKLNGSFFINSVQATEMAGQTIYQLSVKKDDKVKIIVARIPYRSSDPYRPKMDVYSDVLKAKFYKKDQMGDYKKLFEIKDSVGVVTGGDDLLGEYGPTTRVGVVLNDIENYDRAVKDIRRLNHVLARITPVIETSGEKETQSLSTQLSNARWTIGKMYIGTGKFRYEVPGSGAHENLKIELITSIKNISAVTGVPVHWLGYVDLMSNRSTADSLYEVIKNSTIAERTIHAEAMYKLILDAQQLYIDNGGDKLVKMDRDFEVNIPLLDFSGFLDRVRALSLAFNDGVISKFDYQSSLPGIDPLETNKELASEKEEEINQFKAPMNGAQEEQDGDSERDAGTNRSPVGGKSETQGEGQSASR